MLNCNHETIIDNICVICGYTQETELVSYVTHMEAQPSRGFANYKYSLPDNDYYHTLCVKQILEPFNKIEYLEEIKNICTKREFSTRMAFIDKVVIVTYFVLKRDEHPILLCDFSKITKKGIKFLLKHACREFPYIRNSHKYIKGIVQRVYQYLKQQGHEFDQENLFKQVLGFYSENEWSISVIDVILYTLFREEYIYNFDRFNLAEFTSLKKIAKIELFFKERIINTQRRNTCLVKRVMRIEKKLIKGKDIVLEDEIDLYLESILLAGRDPSELKKMTMKAIKDEMENIRDSFEAIRPRDIFNTKI